MNGEAYRMTNVMPDSALASNMRKQMENSEKLTGRDQSEHAASEQERLTINENNDSDSGDYQRKFNQQKKSDE
ncbi:MAG: hypothetical protein H0W62_11500 [Chitinophagales bacterium]|nr:hypothetical protein [Chitinophagales bacterium]